MEELICGYQSEISAMLNQAVDFILKGNEHYEMEVASSHLLLTKANLPTPKNTCTTPKHKIYLRE